jgi:hypothetical protein
MLWLKAVPWTTIISNAPLIVDGAKKLASLVRTTSSSQRTGAAELAHASSGPNTGTAALQGRIQQLEEEQRQSAELLRAMAETNAQMAQALEYLRARAKVNGRIAVLALAAVILLGGWVLLH